LCPEAIARTGAEQPTSNFQGKEIDNHENQNERESRDYQRDCSYRRLKPGKQHLFSKKGKDSYENQNECESWQDNS
jgi:hypothetical protein